MATLGECSICLRPAILQCVRCTVLQVYSYECLVRALPHEFDCNAIIQGRDLATKAGIQLPGGVIPLQISADEYHALFSPIQVVHDAHATTALRLHSMDPTLSTVDKVHYYCDVLKAYDSSSDQHQHQHQHRSLVHKMLLNRMYIAFDLDATLQLLPYELDLLTQEQMRLGIGAHVKRLQNS